MADGAIFPSWTFIQDIAEAVSKPTQPPPQLARQFAIVEAIFCDGKTSGPPSGLRQTNAFNGIVADRNDIG
jgi:hypothetical protein